MRTEKITLQIIEQIGYANFAALVIILLGAKGGWEHWMLVVLPPLVSAAGTAVYVFFWTRFFAHTPRAEGRNYMRPYLLGTAVTIGALLLVIGLNLLAGARV